MLTLTLGSATGFFPVCDRCLKEQRELDELPASIEALETEQSALQGKMSQADFYQQDGETIAAADARLKQVATDLEYAYHRWEELEGRGKA